MNIRTREHMHTLISSLRLVVLQGSVIVVFFAFFFGENDCLGQSLTLDEQKELDYYLSQYFYQALENPQEQKEKATVEVIALGKKLYADNILSEDQSISCNSCHKLSHFGVDNKQFSRGVGGYLTARNSPSTFNAALHFTQFWDGREPDVESQVAGPILNPHEMAMSSAKEVEERLRQHGEYPLLFKKAFQDDAVSFEQVKSAIGAFERTLITHSRFDSFLQGDKKALTIAEQKGLLTFVRTDCITCHTSKTLGGQLFHKFGIFQPYWNYTHSAKIDSGRYMVTEKYSDLYLFKVPSLRNVAKTAPYLHDGSIKELEDVVRTMSEIQTGKRLSSTEVEEIITFLHSLTGELAD